MKKILCLVLVALLVYAISANPAQAADTADAALGHLEHGLRNAGTFIHELVT